MSKYRTITPEDAVAMIRDGAVLIDVRGTDEHRRLRIPGAISAPLDRLEATMPSLGNRKVIFHCRSGQRTTANAERLTAIVGEGAYILAGGLDAWRKSGFPVIEDRAQPLEIMRQAQIVAGSLVLAGVLLGSAVSPAFYALSGLVGVGLLIAGMTGFCGMARLLTWVNGQAGVSSTHGG